MDAYEIRDFITSMGLNMCFDTSHSKLYCNWAHADLYDQLETLLPHISHLHLADAAGLDGEGLQIGEGNIDWIRVFRTLGDYPNTFVPEIWRGHQRGGEGFKIAIQRLSVAYSKAIGEPQEKSLV
jgi:N-acetylneuraminate synthase